MDKLKKFFEENRDDFDHLVPPEGHFDRYREKQEIKKIKPWYLDLRVAATLILSVLLTSLTYMLVYNNQGDYLIAGADHEMEETIYYYSLINNEMQLEIEQMEFDTKIEKVSILSDIDQYDKNLKPVLKDLKMYPDDERVKHAVIEHLKEKTEMLQHIISQIELNKQ